MRNRNVWILLAAALLIALVLAAALLFRPGPGATGGDAPRLTVQGGEAVCEPRAYLVVTLDRTACQPVPLDRTGTITIAQGDGVENVVEITPHGVRMLSATCHNQDCVHQGTVTLESMDLRVLGNMIICLPHKVSLALYSAEDIAAMQEGDAAP